jgi:hypothetical protein
MPHPNPNAVHVQFGGAAKKPASSLVAPTALSAALNTASSVQLNWTDNCTTAVGYMVLRSIDGAAFGTVASIGSSTVNSYIDSGLAGGHTYTYEVEAYGGGKTTSPSNKASVTVAIVAPAAPTGLTASLGGTWINLAWNASSNSDGYYVLRSTDGTNFAQIAQITSGTTDLDSAVAAGVTYYYQVEAYNAAGASPVSNTAFLTTPSNLTPGGVAITTRFSNELIITASGANDSIWLSQSGSTLSITADGQLFTEPVPQAGVFVYTRGGGDGISIDASVTIRATIETIDGGSTAINSSGANVSAWIDSTDSYSGTGIVHRVSAFAGGVSKALGASLPDPSDSGSVVQVNGSLWGAAPVAGDVNQGEVGDCYFVASLAAFAGEKPSVLTESAVDMGDGTYVVQYESGSTPVFVRVSSDMPTGPFNGLMYAHPGTNGTIWAMVMEKAFCYFRNGANTYASISSGSMGEVYADLGVSYSSFNPNSYSESSFYSMMQSDLSGGKAVTLGTSVSPPNLVGAHAYTLISVYKDASGVTHYVVRNPWGSSGDALEDGGGYATLTFAQVVANFLLGYQAL